jgi:hypothetical protein
MTTLHLSDQNMNMGIYFCFSVYKDALPFAFSYIRCKEIFRGDLWNVLFHGMHVVCFMYLSREVLGNYKSLYKLKM